jgi:hypothetical protein
MVLTAYLLDNPSQKVDQDTLNKYILSFIVSSSSHLNTSHIDYPLVALFAIDRLGVLHWNLDPNDHDGAELKRICNERGYTYRDFVDSTKMTDLKSRLATFLIE